VGNELCADVVSYGFRRFRPDWHFFFTHSHGTRRVLFIDEFHVYKVFTRFIKYHHDDFPGYVNAIVCMNFGEGDGLLRDFITAWWSIVLVRIILLLLYFNSYEMWCFRNTCFFSEYYNNNLQYSIIVRDRRTANRFRTVPTVTYILNHRWG